MIMNRITNTICKKKYVKDILVNYDLVKRLNHNNR